MRSVIVAEDKHILVCYKPAGLAVQSSRIQETDMVSELKNYLAGKGNGAQPYLGVVHRLDQPVAGLLVFARTPQAAAELSRQAAGDAAGQQGRKQAAGDAAGQQGRKRGKQAAKTPEGEAEKGMRKEYCALVYTGGLSALHEGSSADSALLSENAPHMLDDYLLKDGRQNTSAVVPEGTKGAKRAKLLYRVEDMQGEGAEMAGEKHALVRIRLLTGRHHQIRVQFAHAGMPLLGDNRYGNEESCGYSKEKGIRSICLCACGLSFLHPATGKRVEFRTEELPWRNG